MTLFQRGADANEFADPLARKVCEIFHVFGLANVIDNFCAGILRKKNNGALLRQYAKNQSNEAFATLVARHINLVYSVALLQMECGLSKFICESEAARYPLTL